MSGPWAGCIGQHFLSGWFLPIFFMPRAADAYIRDPMQKPFSLHRSGGPSSYWPLRKGRRTSHALGGWR